MTDFPRTGSMAVTLHRSLPDENGDYDTNMELKVEQMSPEDIIRGMVALASYIRTPDPVYSSFFRTLVEAGNLAVAAHGLDPELHAGHKDLGTQPGSPLGPQN